MPKKAGNQDSKTVFVYTLLIDIPTTIRWICIQFYKGIHDLRGLYSAPINDKLTFSVVPTAAYPVKYLYILPFGV